MRALAATLLGAAVALLGACGPTTPAGERGEPADPVPLLHVLPSPGEMRGGPAAPADAAALQEALTGAPDAELAERIRDRAPRAAAVRSWEGPGGARMVASVSVWRSHLIATGVGTDAVQALAVAPGGSAWSPASLRGSRGARLEAPGRRERRLAYAVGPNTLYVLARGPVADDVVVRTVRRLVQAHGGRTGS